ncbi:sulfite exporter TauE/SafE family protein [Patescibacteria group bacterium]
MSSKNKQMTLHIDGMHCASCELIVERELLKEKGIKVVEASAANGQVNIFYQGQKPLMKKFEKFCFNQGYRLLDQPVSKKEKTSILTVKNGQLLLNREKLFPIVQGLLIISVLLVSFWWLTRSQLASRVVVNASSPLLAFLIFGLVAGVSSCAALVGGLVLSMSKRWAEVYQNQDSSWKIFQPHLMFNFGRLASFFVLGGLLGALGEVMQLSLTAASILTILVSVIMVSFGLQMLGVKMFSRFQLSSPKFFSRWIVNESNFKGRLMPGILGVLTFFLPCGFTLTVQGLALASGSMIQGAMMMLSFALGTLPILLAIGLSSQKIVFKPQLGKVFFKVAGVAVILFGFYNFNSQLNVLGLPSLNDWVIFSSYSAEAVATEPNGFQVIKMDAFAYGYEPSYFKVQVGIPVRWEISNQGVSGCTNAIVSRSLFEGQVDLSQGLTIKEFTPEKPGRYKFSCWMGMVNGIIEVVDSSGSSGPVIKGQEKEIPSGVQGCGCSGS